MPFLCWVWRDDIQWKMVPLAIRSCHYPSLTTPSFLPQIVLPAGAKVLAIDAPLSGVAHREEETYVCDSRRVAGVGKHWWCPTLFF